MDAGRIWEYWDFILRIEPLRGRIYRVEAEGPTGEAESTFDVPFSERELQAVRVIRAKRGPRPQNGEMPAEVRALMQMGGTLYEALFTGEVRDIFLKARHDASQENRGLRIQLRMANAPELADLPWEYLYDGRRFLGLSAATPIVRYLDLPDSTRPLKAELPLRILVTISSPSDLPPLDVALEEMRVRQALGKLIAQKVIELTVLRNTTTTALLRLLRQSAVEGRPFHVWHYIGHGRRSHDTGESVILLCDEAGKSRPIGGFELATLFADVPELRLALLNACEGAGAGKDDPFSGVAAALVEQGIPAVIGMQSAISDRAAIALASEFYLALVDGLPVDAALAEARRKVFLDTYLVEWGIPVLFMRVRDGRLFDLKLRSAPQPALAAGERVGKSNGAYASGKAAGALLSAARADTVSRGIPAAQPPTRPAAPVRRDLFGTRFLTMAVGALDKILPRPATGSLNAALPPVQTKSDASRPLNDLSRLAADPPTPTTMVGDRIIYRPLPLLPERRTLTLPWRLLLDVQIGQERHVMMGVDLYGDMVIGRGLGESGLAVLDLDSLGAQDLGVSREHTLMRATATGIWVSDRGSTNGTHINGVPCRPGEEIALKQRDMLVLGNLTITVHVQSVPQAASA
jgi:hypothetical protein